MVDRCIEGDPRKFMLLGSYQPVFDVGGELMGVSIAVVDITVQHAAGLGAAGSGEARAAPDARLTPRQRDVLSMLVEGRSAKEIARQMGLGVGTVKAHLSAIYAALGARNRIEAITRAGLLRSPRVDAPAWC
jgi:DNA-binding CsgD family transcriptional regulator